ncbi:MAG: hypothetical protein ABGW87_11595 [Sphingomonadaceae bacterium]
MNIVGSEVLLVEDEIIIGFALDDLVSDMGAHTTLVTTMENAMSTLAVRQFDLAVLDVNLHGELTYPLADLLADQGCRFIFATGYGSVTHPERFASIPTVSKPYNSLEVFNALKQTAKS